ncbi:DoxX family membrane protein [Alicyclobacillus sp. ALC3]|uniref:DoxX family membrane protein n=1 Tax=Alicyclobacillus sp. ALC3 TaxID=2796143 RepID=UPI002378D755|nr:DoxX family membrane protein [Alicyclobacillus sp. ALC3]WDL95955.1 DoxX family membrane protein [Alicyclobacillus sp. ALC3]
MKLSNTVLQGHSVVVPENPVSHFFFSSTRSAWFWLVVRLYVGYEWIHAGWEKLHSPVWTGTHAGVALRGFLLGALGKVSTGDVQGWYAKFLSNVVIPHAHTFSYVVSFGEFLVGLGLILGLLTGPAAFFGTLMNATYLFAGTLSVNPILFILATWLVLAWKVAGWYGLDRFALPYLGTPWRRTPALVKALRPMKTRQHA